MAINFSGIMKPGPGVYNGFGFEIRLNVVIFVLFSPYARTIGLSILF